MRKSVIAAGMAAGLVVLAACGGGSGSGSSQGAAASGGALNLATLVAAQSWDLADAPNGGNTAQYYQTVYDSLIKLDPQANPTANLATKWTYDSAQTTLTLDLRTDVKFTDGTAFDATAVKANIEHDQQGAGDASKLLGGVTDVAVVDADTVSLTLAAPDPSLVTNLGGVAGMVASPKTLGSPDAKTTPVGTGPYVLDATKTVVGSTYSFTRNPDYWNKAAYPFDSVVLKPLDDATAVLNALQSGQVSGAYISDPKNLAAAQGAGLTITKYQPGAVAGLFIWDRAGTMVPALGEQKVRQAINYALDKDSYIKTVNQGLGVATTQNFNPQSTAFVSSLDSNYSYDPAKAKQLLTEAGYPDGFTVTMPDESAIGAAAQAAVTQQLADIGITVNYEQVNPQTFITDLIAGKWPMAAFTLDAFTSWDTIQLEFTKNSPWNPFHYEDPQVAEWINQAQVATGDEQAQLFQKINTYIVDQAWNAPINSTENAYATKGISFTPQAFSALPPIANFKPGS